MFAFTPSSVSGLRVSRGAFPLAFLGFLTVFTAGVIYLLRLMAAPPHPGEQGPSHDVPIRSAGITPAAGAATEGAAR